MLRSAFRHMILDRSRILAIYRLCEIMGTCPGMTIQFVLNPLIIVIVIVTAVQVPLLRGLCLQLRPRALRLGHEHSGASNPALALCDGAAGQ